FDYWLSDDTLNQTPESSLAMVAGARNRLPLIREQLKFFNWGDEVLPGIEAVDTHGHTPGHTSFAVHSGNESLLVLGDALTHPVFSFQRPQWHRATDIDPETAAQQRGKLLDRLVADSTLILGFHLPDAGFGRVEKAADQYQLISQTM
ncbi:MAG: MBL fold metallo-hydrolase, partial [Granulosicoccus sp.]|nr:MBL fold metallo-hydrolase [Granulosicoccus sp.]